MKRKGARSISEIPNSVLKQLNAGDLETANLMEWLAIDQRLLLKNFLVQIGRKKYLESILSRIDKLPKQTVNTICQEIGTSFLRLSSELGDTEVLKILGNHKSDMIRSWATYSISHNPNLKLTQKFQKMQVFAADAHFGVREIAWLSLRSSVVQNLEESIFILSKWTNHKDKNIRRFASEITRPRGVWCEHITVLKQNPELGLPILEPLRSDSSKYVRDSVGNWLNDASKSRSEFVKKLSLRWRKESKTPETEYILKKALRSLVKDSTQPI